MTQKEVSVHPKARKPVEVPKELRDAHPEGLYRSRVRLPGNQGTARFFWRQPTYADAEAYYAKPGDTITANVNLANSLVVGPGSEEAVEQLERYPVALARWVEREVAPFFGAGAEISSEQV